MSAMSDHEIFITEEREQLEDSLRVAVGSANSALSRVRHLSSDQVYDIEYAEGNGDVARLLEFAVSALAGAQAIVLRRHE